MSLFSVRRYGTSLVTRTLRSVVLFLSGIVLCLILSSLFTADCSHRQKGKPILGTSDLDFGWESGKRGDGYTDDVDLRIIVLTYKRADSLLKLLESLDDLELDGDKAAMEIWVDVDVKDQFDESTVAAARSFHWKKGPSRVHVQPTHVGIIGQWIDTWRPNADSHELCIILEDDITVSPMAYRFVKAVHKAMANVSDFVGVTLQGDGLTVLSDKPKGKLAVGKKHTIFMYKGFGTWGFSPKLEHWRLFQDWYHSHKPSVKPHFRPYIPGSMITRWYRRFEMNGTAHNMWSMWFAYYMHIEQSHCVYSNLAAYIGSSESCLAINRREPGLHYQKKGRESYCKLLRVWREDFVNFPKKIIRLNWDASAFTKETF